MTKKYHASDEAWYSLPELDMNPIILTKISKHTIIASLSALLSFAAKFNPQLQRFFIYLYVGVLAALLITILWEGRQQFEQPEESLTSILPNLGMGASKPKRQYLLPPNARLELIIVLIVTTVAALVGSL